METLPIAASNPIPVRKVKVEIPTQNPKGNGRGMSNKQKSTKLDELILYMTCILGELFLQKKNKIR